MPDPASPSPWGPFAHSPLPRSQALLLAFTLAALPVAWLGRCAEIAWIRLIATPAEAVIIGPPRVEPSSGRGGPSHWPMLQVTLPDGRAVTATASHPLKVEIIPGANEATAPIRRPPQAGDRVAIRLHGADPVRLTPERALTFNWSPLVEAIFLLALASIAYPILRGRKPDGRLPFEDPARLNALIRRSR